MGKGVRRFLAQRPPARLAACVVVALAAIVWLGIAFVVLRALVVAVLVLAGIWCAWLVATVWRGDRESPSTSAPIRLLARARAAFVESPVDGEPTTASERDLYEQEDVALAAFRSAADALMDELLARQERLHADAKSLQRELADQIEAMRAAVDRIVALEHEVARSTPEPERTLRSVATAPAPAGDAPADPDVRAAIEELEADLRLEKIEELEQLLVDREERLDRRERELAAFVAETQARLS